jgi:TonB dependent receptor/TonB-dependent Receptor Plug Domain
MTTYPSERFLQVSDRPKVLWMPPGVRTAQPQSMHRTVAGALLTAVGCITVAAAPTLAADSAGSTDSAEAISADSLEEVVVTAARLDLLGSATTASEGVAADQEIQLTPQYRPGQVLETVPGLIVTLHSGEGKANQYLMRGYNLDHGTDLETYVDGVPINQPTHAHGQGYTDLNFLVPELADEITYTKGPYYADIGDFGAVGSVHVSYRDTIPDQVSATVGTLDFQRVVAAGSEALGDGHLLGFAEVQHYDGPFVTPDDARKENMVLRYSAGDQRNGYSVTGMYYHQLWTNTTDIPIRAIAEGLVPNRFGTLNPNDGGHAQRASLSVNYYATVGNGQFSASGFFIYNQLHLFNDFTHFLVDPIHGDQEDQFENRRVSGGSANYVLPVRLGSIDNELSVGGLTRYDLLGVGRLPSEDQMPLPSRFEPPSYSNDDQVYLFAGALYLQAVTHWTSTIRTALGVRDDYQHGTDVDYLSGLHERAGYTNGGTAQQSLIQPKGSLIYAPSDQLEFYLAAGRGFHSADIRGVNQDTSVDLGLPHTPLLARQEGQEVGVRATVERNLAITFAVYNLWQQSETIIDPDVGQDSAGPPSRRYGYEVNITYQISRWLEFYGSYSGNHTRFTHPFDDGTGHLGTYITDAPVATGAFALYLTDLGPWSGGLMYRYLGNYPLSSGPCVDSAAVHDFPGVATSCTNAPTALGQVNAKGFGELNLDLHYAIASGWSASLGLYNLLNTHAAAAEFWYVDRLQNEISTYPDGRADVHEHPLEPFMARFTISKRFGP